MGKVKTKEDRDREICGNKQLIRWIEELTLKVDKLKSSIEDKEEEKNMSQQCDIELQKQLNNLRNMEDTIDGG